MRSDRRCSLIHDGGGRALEEGFRCLSGAGGSLLPMLSLRGPIGAAGLAGPASWTGDRGTRFERLAVSDQHRRLTGHASRRAIEERGDGSGGRDRLGVADACLLRDR
jgi:hypothetical protein